ncbi:MAG TPA: hypothetical protein VGK81_02025 [Anaerolineae bacterium]
MSHVTIAASEKAFEQLFKAVRNKISVSKSDSGSFGPFSASYSIKLHLDDGSMQLNNDGTIEIKNVEVVFDILKVQVCFDLPGFCIGGWCIVPDPWNGCLVSVPGFCIGGPICIPIDLSGLVSEINDIKAHLTPRYFVDPARLPAWSDLDAEYAGKSNMWQIYIDPDWVSVDPIDIPATINNIVENILKNAINNLFPSWLPGWAKDLIWAFLGPLLDLLKSILGFLDNFQDFLQNLLGNTFDILGFIETAVADYFANKYPIYQFEDPYPLLPQSGALIPVKIPLRNLTATVNTSEMIVLADVG